MANLARWISVPGRLRLLGALVIGLSITAFGLWTAYVVLADRSVDYYTYLIAADAFAHGQNIYRDPSLYAVGAERLAVPDYAPP
jgi:hypothetical protein